MYCGRTEIINFSLEFLEYISIINESRSCILQDAIWMIGFNLNFVGKIYKKG